MKKRGIYSIADKWLILLLIASSVVACDSGNERENAPEFIGMINVELKDVSPLSSGIFQLYIDGKFDSAVTSTCMVSHVQPSDVGKLDCSTAIYDENSATLTITMSIDTGNANLTLDFTDASKVIATLEGVSTYVGGAVLVSPALVSRSVVTYAGDKYTELTLLNPPMGENYISAEIKDSNGYSASATKLWDNDIPELEYATLYQSYLRSDTNDGIAQGSLTYVTQQGVPIAPDPLDPFNTLLPPETYTVGFVPPPAAGTKEYKVTIAADATDATKPLDPISLFKDKPLADPPVDPPIVPAEKELPPKVSEIAVEIDTVPTVIPDLNSVDFPLIVGEGPYKFSWRNTLALTSDKWQVTFYTIDNSTITPARIRHSEKRTNRILANGVGGPIYTAATVEQDITTDREWSWLLPADMTFNADDVVEVEFRASNFANTLNGIAQSFYITKVAPALP